MNLQQRMNSIMFWGKKNSPYILFGVGVVSTIAAVVEAIHATSKMDTIIDDYEIDIQCLMEKFGENTEEFVNAKRKRNTQLVLTTTKVYLPTVLLTGAGIFAFGGSFSIMNKRYTAVSAALATTTTAFNNYRERVMAEEDGYIKDYAYMNGLAIEEVEEKVTDPETGKTKKVKKKVLTGVPQKSLYSYRWEKYNANTKTGSTQWDSVSSYAIPFIENVIAINQQRLDHGSKDYIWLVDLLTDLGFDEGVFDGSEKLAGWKRDDLITCGLEDIGESKILAQDTMDFLYGDSPDVTLIFNCRPNLFQEEFCSNDNVIDSTATEVEENA